MTECGDGTKLGSFGEPVLEGLDERGDCGLGGFDGGFVTQVTEGLAGDGADGGQCDVSREGKVGGFEKCAEVARC